MGKTGNRYTPRLQFQVVLEVLKGDREAVEGAAVGKLDYREYHSQRKSKACTRLLFVRA